MAQEAKSKLTVYTDASTHLIPQTAAGKAKRSVNREKKKAEAEEPLYINRV